MKLTQLSEHSRNIFTPSINQLLNYSITQLLNYSITHVTCHKL